MLKKARAQRNAYAVIVYVECKGSDEVDVCPQRMLPEMCLQKVLFNLHKPLS